jgi:single-strand DNA-binding protein
MNHVYYRGDSDEKVEEVCFVDCEAWGRTAEIANEYLKKGSQVCLEGRLKLDTWDDKQTGEKRYKHKLIVEKLIMVGSGGHKPDDSADPRGSSHRKQPPQKPTHQPPKRDPDLDPPEDDEIPF